MRSLLTAGIPFTPVVIQYDGELPDDALCPFVTYTGIERTGRPLFFNEVPVPPWCEIRQGREVYGEILRDGYVIGRINYEPNSFRQVESVDWVMPGGALSHTDRYDRYGNRHATTYYADGVAHQTVHRGPGEWQIEVNHITRDVTMRSLRSVITFATLTDFVSHFLDEQGIAGDRVLINSLSHPLFVMRKRAVAPNTTLFWQEPMPGDVPENMAIELAEPTALTDIVFFDEKLRRRVAAQHPGTALRLSYLSHLGQFAEKRGYDRTRAFTLTNTDELPPLVDLLDDFPDVTFTVAALTLMSEKLHELGRRHPNLVLLPTITQRGIHEQLDQASVYLDINAGTHVLDVVKAAYYLDLVVLAAAPFAKAPGHSRVCATVDELKAHLSAAVASPEGRARELEQLHTQHGPRSTPDDYRRLFAP
jgi:accessory Sec system glycosyltransferase GtfB